MASSNIIGVPGDDKTFEENCIPLFEGLLKDPNVKLVGTRGKKQSGLDLIGRRDRDPGQPVGIQCKLIGRGGKLAEALVRKEVAQALTVTPQLTEFYIVTTATDEPALDLLAIALSKEQRDLGRTIDIQIWGWDTLQQKIRAYPAALNAFDPDYSASTKKLVALGVETIAGQHALLDRSDRAQQGIDEIKAIMQAGPVDTARSLAFEAHLDAQIDDYRDLMNAGKPRTALGLLERLSAGLTERSSVAIRARVTANMAFAHMKLGDDARGAAMLTEAYALNPIDPKVRANRILALAMSGDTGSAFDFARHVLTEDPANAGAAGMAFQVAAISDDPLDPLPIIPSALLDEMHVRIHHISYLRQKDTPASWWALAAETHARFPDEGIVQRMAGDALIDDALSDHAMERSAALSPARVEKLRAGAALLQGHWDSVRHYENAAETSWLIVGSNLLTAYRALGALDIAQEICAQILAIGVKDPDIFLAAAHLAMDRDDPREAIRLLELVPDSAARTLVIMAAWSNLEAWSDIIAYATNMRRAALDGSDQQAFDVMRFRARRFGDPGFDRERAVEALLEAWPLGIAAHIAVADIFRQETPDALPALSAKAKSLISAQTSYGDRVMFAQLSMFCEAWDDVIDVLDGHVPLDRASDPLTWLALAFANGGVRPRTKAFFASLASDVIALSRYARLAGAAEHNRGDLRAAERYLRAAIATDPTDLRAHLLLNSTLERGNRLSDATDMLRGIEDAQVQGSPEDHIRLAHLHRRHGDVERALLLGYRTAAANRTNETVLSSYPALIFLDEFLPDPIGRAGPAAPDFWFDLRSEDGRDVQGVIDRVSIPGVETYAPDHPLAAALMGKVVDDQIVMPSEFGPERRYVVRALKHKYIWLLHDIMATHAARFPQATSMWEMTMKEGDVQPVLAVVRDLEERGRFITQTYFDNPVPLAAVAAMAKKPVVALAEHLPTINANLRTCLGSLEEREAAGVMVRGAQGKGAVIDTLSVWNLHRMGHLAAAKAYFGRLCIARSTFDDLIEMRASAEINRGREYMTIGYEGDHAWRQIHSPDDTERQIALINDAITDVEIQCEILPVDGSENVRLDVAIGRYSAAQVMDPLYLAHSEGVILISDDLNLRQFAIPVGVTSSAWLQVVLRTMVDCNALDERDYLIAVGMLAAMRHDHVWLDAPTLIGILTLDDPRADNLFEAAIQFMGGRKAEMASHMGVTTTFMMTVWHTALTGWKQGRAIGALLSKLLRERPDWKAVLYVLDRELVMHMRAGHSGARLAHAYLEGWIKGHFYDLTEIRSAERLIEASRANRSMKLAQASKKAPKTRGRPDRRS